MEWKQAAAIENGFNIPARWVYLHYYEAFNLLFRIENALRVFVYIVLKNAHREKWTDVQVSSDDGDGTIAAISKKRMSQAQSFGYLCHAIASPLMHLNSGELTRLIVQHWRLFNPYFQGSKEIIKNKLDEIGTIRNSLAHFRPIKADDVDVIKQNSKHALLGIEQFLNQVLFQSDVVPTNTVDSWYKDMKTVGTDLCTFMFRQSPNEQWVRISMKYICPTIKKRRSLRYMRYNVLTIRSSAILSKYPEIASDICYLSEDTQYPKMISDDNDAEFGKALSFVVSREMLDARYSDLKKSLASLLIEIDKETELIQQDNLARGVFIHSATAYAILNKEGERTSWDWHDRDLLTPVTANDPPEYWGDLNFYASKDFVGAASIYPWMPESVSAGESEPF